MRNYFDAFLQYLAHEQRVSNLTIEAYTNDLRFWESAIPGLNAQTPPGEMRKNILQGLKTLREQNFKESTQHRKRAVLRSYFRFRAYGDDTWSALANQVPLANHEELLPKALPIEEISKLLVTVESSAEVRAGRDSVLLNLLYSSGLRISEALSLTWTDLDEQQQVLRVSGKGNKERLVPYSERSARALKLFKEKLWPLWAKGNVKQKDIFLGPRGTRITRMGAWKALSHWSQSAGIGHVHPHVLRHSFATHLLAGGADVRVVQALLGHSSINTTERYLKIDDEDVRKLFKNFHPLP